MIVIDFETNSSNKGDVVEVAVLKVKKNESGFYEIVDTFHRYYHSHHPLNPHTVAVHGLTPEVIEYRRNQSDDIYAEYFDDDYEFSEFCKDSECIVAHNVVFELRHIGNKASFSKHVCTMKENINTVKATGKGNRIKKPNLQETCEFFGIDFDKDSYHSAIFDVRMTLEIINSMETL